MSDSNSIPFYKSSVLMAGLAAFIMQGIEIALSAPQEVIMMALSGDVPSIRKLSLLVLTGLVVWFRSRSQVQPVVMSVPDGAGKASALLLAVCAGMLLTGCKTLQENQASVQLVTQYAVAKYLEQKPSDEARFQSAARIIKITTDLKSITGSAQVRLEELRVYVGGALAAQPLSPADRVLASGLAEVLFSELEKRFAGGRELLKAEQIVLVNDVLRWISDVASAIPKPAEKQA